MLKIEPGKFYRTRDGRKVGALVWAQGTGNPWPLKTPDGKSYFSERGDEYVTGREAGGGVRRPLELISEWQDEEPTGPVRTVTVTKKQIVPGQYGFLRVGEDRTDSVAVSMVYGFSNAQELRDAAKVLKELAEALEENASV